MITIISAAIAFGLLVIFVKLFGQEPDDE